jgi:hypothetical protein
MGNIGSPSGMMRRSIMRRRARKRWSNRVDLAAHPPIALAG